MGLCEIADPIKVLRLRIPGVLLANQFTGSIARRRIRIGVRRPRLVIKVERYKVDIGVTGPGRLEVIRAPPGRRRIVNEFKLILGLGGPHDLNDFSEASGEVRLLTLPLLSPPSIPAAVHFPSEAQISSVEAVGH